MADATASWIAGDGSDDVLSSDPDYDQITMRPKTVGCFTKLSRKMLIQADPASEQLVRDSLSFAVAKALDAAAINGSGSGNQPLGVLSQTGINTDTYTSAPTFREIVDMEGLLMADDSDRGSLGYLTTGLMASVLKKTPVVTAMDNMIWTSTGEGEGRVNGYRALSSNLVPTGYVLFGNWSDLIVGLWSGQTLCTDPYTYASSGSVQVTVLQDCDIAVRHGESFAEIHA
ncbi:MAG: phage major capsid protein [Haliea sp.]|nr:phage major capsid protein [Haliea sp.]